LFGENLVEENGVLNIDESVGQLLAGKVRDGTISAHDLDRVKEIYGAYLRPTIASPWVANIKSLIYATTLGSIRTPITQLQDVSFSIADAGLRNTTGAWLSNLPGIKALMNKSGIKLEDVGLEGLGQELLDASASQRITDIILTINGMRRLDRLGKETYLNASFNKFKQLAKSGDAQFKARVKDIYGNQAGQVLKDFRNGIKTPNTIYLPFNDLLNVHPMSLSELPLAYLKSNWGKLAYTLKSFTLKQLDYQRRILMDKVINATTKEEKIKGLRKLAKYFTAFIVTTVGASYLKDKVSNKDFDAEDATVDALWKLIGASKYEAAKVKDEGVFATAVKKILPPHDVPGKVASDIGEIYQFSQDEKATLEDLGKKLKSVKHATLVGDLYYNWYGRGREMAVNYKDFDKLELDMFDFDKRSQRKLSAFMKQYFIANRIEDLERRKSRKAHIVKIWVEWYEKEGALEKE